MALPNAKNQYLKTQIETASKEQLVVMLFDGIIRFTELARKAMREGQVEDTHNALMRAQAIVMELICTVDRDKGGEIAGNLMGLHAYAFNCLIVANMKKEEAKIDEVQGIYRELREGWIGAMERLGISGGAAPASAPAPAPAPVYAASAVKSAASSPVPASIPSAPALPSGISGGSGGVMASAGVVSPVLAATGYGMGRSAALSARAPAAAPAAASSAASSAAPASAPGSAKQAAMLSAYGKARSIA